MVSCRICLRELECKTVRYSLNHIHVYLQFAVHFRGITFWNYVQLNRSDLNYGNWHDPTLQTFSLRQTDGKHIKSRIIYPPTAHKVGKNVGKVHVPSNVDICYFWKCTLKRKSGKTLLVNKQEKFAAWQQFKTKI